MAKSVRDGGLVKKIIKGEVKLPFSVKADNLRTDYTWFNKKIMKEGGSDSVGMSREKDRGLLWFHKRKR